MGTLMRYFGPQVQAAGVVLLLTLAAAAVVRRRAPGSAASWSVLSTGVAVALLAMTTWPSGGSGAPRRVQWVPLRTVAEQLAAPDHVLAVINLVGNVAVFVPLGFCLRMALRRAGRPAQAAVLVGAAVSLLAELVQLAVGSRATDVDDLLLNTVGVALGAGLAAGLAALLPSPSAGPAARMTGWSSRT